MAFANLIDKAIDHDDEVTEPQRNLLLPMLGVRNAIRGTLGWNPNGGRRRQQY